MTDQPDDDFDATQFNDYPKFPTLVGYFGHQPSEPAGADEDAFRHGHGEIVGPGRLAIIPDHSVANNLAAIAQELHTANLIAWAQLTHESNRAQIRKRLGLIAEEQQS